MPAAILKLHSVHCPTWRRGNWAGFNRTNRNSCFPLAGDTCTLLQQVMLFDMVWSSSYLTFASFFPRIQISPPDMPKGCVTKSTNLEKWTVMRSGLHAAWEPWEDQWSIS